MQLVRFVLFASSFAVCEKYAFEPTPRTLVEQCTITEQWGNYGGGIADNMGIDATTDTLLHNRKHVIPNKRGTEPLADRQHFATSMRIACGRFFFVESGGIFSDASLGKIAIVSS